MSPKKGKRKKRTKRKLPKPINAQATEILPRKGFHEFSSSSFAATPVFSRSFTRSNEKAARVNFNNIVPARRPFYNNTASHPDDYEWEPTIAQQLTGLIGKPLPKPAVRNVTSSALRSMEINRLNLRKISSNIRRKKLIAWTLTFTFIVAWTGFLEILLRLLRENDDVFSMKIIKPWMTPSLIVEFTLTGLGVIGIILKIQSLKGKSVGVFYRFITTFNNLRYLLGLVGLPCGVYFFFTELSTNMRAELSKSLAANKTASISWKATQTERQCCGHHGRHDWNSAGNKEIQDYDEDQQAEILKEMQIEEIIVYPVSCCNRTMLQADKKCTESSNATWTVGCHDTEFFIMLDYFMCTLGLMLASLILSIMIRLWVDKMERYLTIFRPRQLFKKDHTLKGQQEEQKKVTSLENSTDKHNMGNKNNRRAHKK